MFGDDMWIYEIEYVTAGGNLSETSKQNYLQAASALELEVSVDRLEMDISSRYAVYFSGSQSLCMFILIADVIYMNKLFTLHHI